MGANLTFARCLDGSCDWWSDVQPGISITFLATEAQQHADATGHAVHLTYTIPARAGCDPVAQPLGLCRCSSADENVRATACTVHGRS